MQARLIGLGALLFGLLLGWAFAPDPYAAHAPDPLYDVSAFVVAALAVAFGSLLLIGGERLYRVINSPAESTDGKGALTLLYVLAAIVAIGTLLWYHSVIPLY